MESMFNDETPKKRVMCEEKLRKSPVSTPNLTPKNFARYLLLSNNSKSFTPSPSALSQRVVRNPFESQLHERLHLPMISSPSLFQTMSTATPKLQFEWTIDELSLLNPIHLVPHETQFCEDMDPIREAEAQAAINSFFQEQKIVPSPRECSLRNQKIVFNSEAVALKFISSNNAVLNQEQQSPAKKNDVATQTALTLPVHIPKEVEDLLKKYQFLDDESHETGLETGNCESNTLDSTNQSNRSMMDVSTLRRKLFINRSMTPTDTSEALYNNDDLSPAPRSPELHISSYACPTSNGSFGSEFGELSPISPITNQSSNDISMLSECSRDKTPSRGYKKIKKKGKNLSESFCLMQNSGEFKDDQDSIETPKCFDSGFPIDGDSKLSVQF